MESISIFKLIGPFVFLAFASTFLMIYFYNRNRIAPLLYAAAYVSGSAGYLTDIFLRDEGFDRTAYISNSFYIGTSVLMVLAFAKHFNRAPPKLAILALTLMIAFSYLWFSEIQPSHTIRALVMNFGGAAIFALTLRIIPRKSDSLIHNILFWVMLLTTIQFVVRTLGAIYFTGDELAAKGFVNSSYASTFQFVVTLNSVVLAITLCIAMGIEAIVDLQRLSQTDALTGLINRRGFEIEADTAIYRAEKLKLPLSLVVCDIDHFKEVNDVHGHAFGDWVIKGFANELRRRARHSDLAGRIGGEEFCILLPTANLSMAQLVANSCRVSFANKQFRNVASSTRFSASFGVAELLPNEDYQSLFKRADAALYRAKASGRNCVIVAGADEAPHKPTRSEEAKYRETYEAKPHGLHARRPN